MKKTGFAIFLLFLNYALQAQLRIDSVRMHFDFLTVDDGLSQGMVQCIIQDKEGYMWFASKDGLNRYDGYSFKVYRNNPNELHSLPDNYVTFIHEDDQGNIWIGTNFKGVCLLDKESETFYPVPLGIGHNNESIQYINSDAGKLKIITNTNTCVFDISRIRKGVYTPEELAKIKIVFNYNAQQALNSRKITPNAGIGSYWVSKHELWVYFTDSVFRFRFNTSLDSWKHSGFSSKKIGTNGKEEFHLKELKNENKVLVLSTKTLSLVDLSQGRILHSVDVSPLKNYSGGVYTDNQNRIFFNTPIGNFCFNPHNYTLAAVKSNIPSFIACHNSFTDRNNAVWIGTSGYGIYIYQPKKECFRNSVYSSWYYSEGHSGNLFLYNRASFIRVINPESGAFIRNVAFPNRKPDGGYWNDGQVRIYGMQSDANGMLWINGSDKSNAEYLVWMDTKTYAMGVKQITNQGKVRFRKLMIDRDNRLWILKHHDNHTRSIVEFDKVNKEVIHEYFFPAVKDMNEYYFISDWYQDSKGIFWFGTLQGLFSFNEKKREWHQWKNIPNNKKSLSSNLIFSICPDAINPSKYLWIGTNGSGLNKFELASGHCQHFTEKDGLPNSVIYCVQTDDAGNVWMSTNKGLSCWLPSASLFRNFSKEDGLPGNEFNRYEKLTLHNRELLFGGVAGFTMFNPKEVLQRNAPGRVVLTNLAIYNKNVTHLMDSAILKKPIGYSKNITLPFSKNMFTIEFALLEFSPANKKKYKYKLEGFNDEWIFCGEKHEATFTNLAPGHYQFQVAAAGSDGIWTHQGASIQITILPAWYQTWWFRLLMVLLIGGCIYALYRYQLAQQKKLYSVRNNIAKDLHDDIGSVLSSISLSTNIIQNKLSKEDSDVQKLLSKVSDSSSQMIDSMSDIVWAINVNNDRFEHIIYRMRGFAVEMLEPAGCRIYFNVDPKLKKCGLDMVRRKHLYLVYKEAIHNAAKYANANNIWISMTLKSDKELWLQIKDDGKGFDLGFLGDLKTNYNKGGNGIRNMNDRVALMKGKIDIQSSIGTGTEITISLKL